MEICQAIKAKRVIRFHYNSGKDPGYRTVEPHMVAYTKDENLALSAWYLGGASESDAGQGWRIYLLKDVSRIEILERQFPGARDGYQADGGKSFHSIQCSL
jgi:hypothetical protein